MPPSFQNFGCQCQCQMCRFIQRINKQTPAHWRRLGASFGGTGRRVSAENFFLPSVPPPPKKSEIWGTAGDSLSFGTNCWLSRSIIVYCRCIYYHIYYPLTPDLCLFLVDPANIEIQHRNIELQVQIKAKFIIQFENQHEFRIENGFRLI